MAEEIVGVKVKVDTSEATQGTEQLNKKFKETGDNAKESGKKATDAIGQLKKDLRAANAELITAQKEFGDYSKEAVAAAKKVAALKDRVQEAAETSALFDPGKKFQVFAGALSATAGGFTAVQGALGLIGVKSENVEKQLLKVQSALALSQGLSTLADSAKDFQRLGTVLKSTTAFQAAYNFIVKGTIKEKEVEKEVIEDVTEITEENTKAVEENTEAKKENNEASKEGTDGVQGQVTATKGLTAAQKIAAGASKVLRAALVSIGIGAISIAVGYLIGNWDKLKKAVMNLIPGLGAVADFIGNIVNKVTDFVGITSEAGRATAKLIADNEKAIKEGERFLDLNGDKYDEYTQRKIKANLEFKKSQNELLNDEKLSEDEKNKYILQARQKADREIANADKDRQKKADEAEKAKREKADALKEKQDQKDEQARKDRQAREEAAFQVQQEAYASTLNERNQALFAIDQKYKQQRETLEKAGIKDFAAIEEQKRLAKEKVNKDFDDKELQVIKDFEKQAAQVKEEARLNSIANEEEKQLETIRSSYKKQRDEILAQKDLTAEQIIARDRLLGEIQLKEAQDIAEQEKKNQFAKFTREFSDLEQMASNQQLTFEMRQAAIDQEQEQLNEAFERKLISEKEFNDKTKKLSEDRIAVQIAEKEAKAAVDQAYLDIASGVAGLAKNLFEKSKGVQIAGLVVEQAASVGKIVSNLGVANLKATATSPLTAGMPWVAINTASAGISIANAIAATAKGISQIRSANSSGGGSASVAPSISTAAPIAPAQPQATMTQLDRQSINQIGSATSRAYVLESDVTNSQERIRRINRAARLG